MKNLEETQFAEADQDENPHEGTRERMISAAIKLFSEKGYHAVSVREIVEAAEVTKPVLYYYFENKEGLFRAIVEGTLHEFEQGLTETAKMQSESFREDLQRINPIVMGSAEEHPELVRLMNAVFFSGLYESLFDFTGYWDRVMVHVIFIFERAQARAEIRKDIHPSVLAHHYMGMATNAMRYRVYMRDLEVTDQLHNQLIDLFIEGAGLKEEMK